MRNHVRQNAMTGGRVSFFDRFKRKPPTDGREVYHGLRTQALSFSPQSVGVSPESTTVFGVLFDLGLDHGNMATFVSLADGTTSMYTSTGGGVIGGGDHDAPAAASRALVAVVEESRALFGPGSTDTSLDDGAVRFIALTPAGPLIATAICDDLVSANLPLSRVFQLANEVMTQLRLISER